MTASKAGEEGLSSFRRGYLAYLSGRELEDNPYPRYRLPLDQESWETGYLIARRKAQLLAQKGKEESR